MIVKVKYLGCFGGNLGVQDCDDIVMQRGVGGDG